MIIYKGSLYYLLRAIAELFFEEFPFSIFNRRYNRFLITVIKCEVCGAFERQLEHEKRSTYNDKAYKQKRERKLS